jgi:hypothetical protein
MHLAVLSTVQVMQQVQLFHFPVAPKAGRHAPLIA